MTSVGFVGFTELLDNPMRGVYRGQVDRSCLRKGVIICYNNSTLSDAASTRMDGESLVVP